MLAAHPSLGVNTVAELIILAKQQPGLRYATGSGFGSSQHMVTQWFAQIAGIQLEQVSYRGVMALDGFKNAGRFEVRR